VSARSKARTIRAGDREEETTMKVETPFAEVDERFSSPGVSALPWTDAERQLRDADVFWLATVRPEGRPHVVPVIAVWLDGSLYFSTGEGEQKAVNLEDNDRVSVMTGSSDLDDGSDVVVEGRATVVTDVTERPRIADAYEAKYGDGWRLPDLEGVVVYEVTPAKVLGFGRKAGRIGPPSGRGERFNQTRWRFQDLQERRDPR
jgi:nitroimidazol reductase NimA-like FMN-containing flavoprotein (pyridoxamine 5'-phosphate oxidase superfamily)